MYKAVVFDLDHTLFDRYKTFSSIIDKGYAYTIFKEEIDKEILKQKWTYADKNFCTVSWDKVYDYLKSEGLLKDNLEKQGFFNNYIVPIFMQVAEAYDFAIPTLKELKKRGYKIGLITNGRHTLQMKKLEMLNLVEHFDEIIISGDFNTFKPDRFLFDEMAKRLDLSPCEMLYVGDNPLNDVEGARNAGYVPVWVKTTGIWTHPEIEKCELEVENVSELLKFL